MINCCSYSKPPTRHCQELNRLTRARRDRAIGDRYGFADAQFEYAAREARRGSVYRDLRPGAAGNDDGLRTLSDRVEPPAYRVGGTPSIVGERAVRKPRKRNLAQRVVPGIIDNGRVGTQWRRAVDAVLGERIAGDQPVVRAALHPDGAARLVVGNLIADYCNPLGAVENDARVGHDQVCAVDDIPAYHDIIVPAFSDDCRALALFDDIARNGVA